MMTVAPSDIESAARKLCVRACTMLPPETAMHIECAADADTSPEAREILSRMTEDFIRCGLERQPLCAAADSTLVYADIGQDISVDTGELESAAASGVRAGYEQCGMPSAGEIELRQRSVSASGIRLTVCPQCFKCTDSRTVSRFSPSCESSCLIRFITSSAESAAHRLCPPMVVGVGLAESAEAARLLAERALIRPTDTRNPSPPLAELEDSALESINALGIGPERVGGDTTALAVSVEAAAAPGCAIFCAVEFSCHAARAAYAEIQRKEEPSHCAV